MKLKEPAERLVSLAECRGYHMLGYWFISTYELPDWVFGELGKQH